ncbi:MAG TPA: hypothetical protein VKP64_12835, partial [Mycobacteriales bacterium]|nr:hypothetical protein [Mycobacteriales bacterium]
MADQQGDLAGRQTDRELGPDMVKVAGIGGPAGAPTLHLSVDGVDVVVEPGATLLEAAGAAGAFVPT